MRSSKGLGIPELLKICNKLMSYNQKEGRRKEQGRNFVLTKKMTSWTSGSTASEKFGRSRRTLLSAVLLRKKTIFSRKSFNFGYWGESTFVVFNGGGRKFSFAMICETKRRELSCEDRRSVSSQFGKSSNELGTLSWPSTKDRDKRPSQAKFRSYRKDQIWIKEGATFDSDIPFCLK